MGRSAGAGETFPAEAAACRGPGAGKSVTLGAAEWLGRGAGGRGPRWPSPPASLCERRRVPDVGSFPRRKAPCTSVRTPPSGTAAGPSFQNVLQESSCHDAQACVQTAPWTLVCLFRESASLVGVEGRPGPREEAARPGPGPRAPPAWTRPACDMPPPGHRFATQERNALLLYNGRFNEKHDFIALEIVDEQVQLTFSAGRAPRGQSGSPAGAGQVKGAPTSRGALGCAHGSAPCPRPGPRPLGRPGTCKGACRVWKSGGTAQRPGPGTRRSAAHGGPRRSRAGRGGRMRPDAQRGAWPPPAHLCFLSAPPAPHRRDHDRGGPAGPRGRERRALALGEGAVLQQGRRVRALGRARRVPGAPPS